MWVPTSNGSERRFLSLVRNAYDPSMALNYAQLPPQASLVLVELAPTAAGTDRRRFALRIARGCRNFVAAKG
jgi:hypothetical protein